MLGQRSASPGNRFGCDPCYGISRFWVVLLCQPEITELHEPHHLKDQSDTAPGQQNRVSHAAFNRRKNVEDRHIINASQHGCMEYRSCQPNSISFSHEITSLVVINVGCNSMDVIDLINAFDLLLHDSLIKKLALYNIDSAHVKRIKNCLNDSSKKNYLKGTRIEWQHFYPSSAGIGTKSAAVKAFHQ